MTHPTLSLAEDVAPTPYEHALADMALILAHRLRGLVSGIEGYTSLLTETLATREQRDLALRILEGAARIEHILSDLQAYSAPLRPILVPVPVGSIVQAAVAALEEEQGVHVQITYEAAASTLVQADPRLLHQALLVLLQNALDATPGHAVGLVIDVAGACVVLHVQNAGALPIEHAEEVIFRPFFTTKAKNLGLGLPLARRIAEAHGGSLVLSASEPEQGTCFTLQVPAGQDVPPFLL